MKPSASTLILWIISTVFFSFNSAYGVEVHIPVIEPSIIANGVNIIPASTGGQITIASDGYCEIFEVHVDGKYVWSGTNYSLAPVTIKLPDIVMDRENHTMKIDYDYDPNGYLKDISYTFRIGGPSTGSVGDFSIGEINYQIISQSNLEVICVGGNVVGNLDLPESVNYNNRTYSVIGIGDEAFKGNEALTGINIPSSAKSIGKNAFKNCILLSEISGGINLEYIEEEAFANCTSLKEVQLFSQLKSIGIRAFYNNTSLVSIYFPEEANISLQRSVFSQCSSLKSLDFNNSIYSIGDYCFEGCNSLQQLIISPKITSIGYGAFQACKSLIEVFFLSSININTSQIFINCHPGLEMYVPSNKECGFGKEYINFKKNLFNYSGQPHNVEWSNNLKAYKCEISESESQTDVNAGQYTKNLKATYSNGVDFSVEIPYEYTINKVPMTLSVNDIQREYGEPNPSFTCNISGFVNGENEQTLGTTPEFECEATQKSKVGNYRILASLNAPNYEITYKYGTLTIEKAPLSATVLDFSKIYGNENPVFLLSYSGLKNNETTPEWSVAPKFSTTATVASEVGQYSVTASNGVAINYDVTKYNPGTLTVSKRDLIAKANDCERLYGEENPQYRISYIGFVNGDSETSFVQKPVAECNATKASNAGTYPIVVTGGEAKNYNFIYQDGSLKISPLTVGFKDVYNSVVYNDMAISTNESYFNYIPKIVGPFSEDDFRIELWFLDKDNKFPQHVSTISGGDYAGNYVNTNVDRTMWAGKYIFNLISKGTNPNVVANPARAYLTVNRASNNLEWNKDATITVKVGEKVDLGITYQADLWCTFNTDYDEELIELSSEGKSGNNPHWFATGLKEGQTTLYFGIECKKNDMGFYDFTDSRTLYKRIVVEPSAGINGVVSDENATSIITKEGSIHILNKSPEAIARVYTIQGNMIAETTDNVVSNLQSGLYILTVGPKSFKVSVR